MDIQYPSVSTVTVRMNSDAELFCKCRRRSPYGVLCLENNDVAKMLGLFHMNQYKSCTLLTSESLSTTADPLANSIFARISK